MLARCQFGLEPGGKCGVIMTYPIKGHPWRRNPIRSHEFHLTAQEALELFEEVRTMPARYPDECLDNGVLWSDQSEKANGITRHLKTGKRCHTLAIYRSAGEAAVYFAMEEDSAALRNSRLHRTIMTLIAPHETLLLRNAEPCASPNGGPAATVDNSGAPGVPPSVS